MFTIRLPEDLAKRLDALSKETKRPKSFYVREALLRTIEDLEDAYLAEREYERFLASGEQAVTSEELERRLGLAD